MHFNAKNPREGYSIPPSSFESNRSIAIDTVTIDNHSRLTITRNLKKVLPIMPKDKIAVFQDRYNKDLVFSIQRENRIVDSLTIRRNYSRNRTDIDNNKSLETNQIELHAGKEKCKGTLHDVNILIVDDESYTLKVYQWILNSEGYYNIQTFTESLKAIKHMADLKNLEHYGLAIIDIRMPVINGIQLYHILKIFNPKLKVLFVSALDIEEDLIRIYHIEQEDILRKPFEPQEFITAVNNAVSKVPQK